MQVTIESDLGTELRSHQDRIDSSFSNVAKYQGTGCCEFISYLVVLIILIIYSQLMLENEPFIELKG